MNNECISEKRKTLFKPGIMTGVFSELEPEEAIRRLAKIGWRNFELYSVHLARLDRRENPEKNFLKLRELCESLNVSIPAMHDGTQGVKSERVMQWAHILDVKWVVIHPAREETGEKNLDIIERWVTLAHKFGVGVAVENMHDCIPREEGRRALGAIPSELLWLVQNSDPNYVGICWDTCHAYVQKLDQYQAIKALGKYLVHTHINDNLLTSEEQHLTLFEGNVDWKEIIKALREVNYKGLFNIEGGRSISNLPLPFREIKLRYLLELMKAMIEKM